MPVDSSQNKRTGRKLTNDEEIDLRRARGEISCAECRRLKLKCDKKLPCSSCVRRGCPSICPNGSLSTGQGTRYVLSDTTQLHSKITEMGNRIRQLEDALAIFQSGVSNESHPLLKEELLAIKFGPEKSQLPGNDQHSSQSSLGSSINAFGTMTVNNRGEGKYFGPSAGSETLILAGAEFETPNDEDEYSSISIEIARLSASFPFGADGNTENMVDLLFDNLPSQPRAWSLCETYFEHAAWTFRPIKRDELIDEILSPTYKALKQRRNPSPTHMVSMHQLAVLFLVFALGALVDLTLEPFNKEAETYFHLSRACLSLRSVFDSPEVSTVQAVLLMAGYHGMAGKRYTMDSLWTLTSLAAKLAQSLGLHRDSARWNMDPKTVQRRRALFWEMFSTETFHSLALGRPPSIRLSYVDCEFPEDDEAFVDENGNTSVGYYRWKYEFTKEILSSVLELTLTAQAPQYKTILDLDRRVREKTLPPHLNVFMSAEDAQCTPSVYMRHCLLGQFRSVTLLYIHRSFFAQAVLDHPVNPLRSPYAPSFLAAYRCASGVIKSSLNHYDRFPELCGRWWSVWTHLFSAAIIVGCIVTRSPSSSMASSAFIELGLACDLYEKGPVQSRRSRGGLAILYKMRDRAYQVYSQFRSGNFTPTGGILSVGRPDYGNEELALFGGQTRVLVSKLLSQSCFKHKSATSPALSNAPSPDSDSKGSSSSEPVPDVHPSLVEYLSMFPPESNLPSPSTSPFPENWIKTEISGPNDVPPDSGQLQSQMHMPTMQHFHQSWPNWQSASNSRQDGSQLHAPPSQPAILEFSSFTNELYPPTTDFQKLNFGRVIETDSPDPKLIDLGMMMAGESGMDEQWMSFIRDSGLFDGQR